jgi:phosphoribosyl-ATP pyrophosphohydrolase
MAGVLDALHVDRWASNWGNLRSERPPPRQGAPFLDICLFRRQNRRFAPSAEPPRLTFTLDDLAKTIALRAEASSEKSYTRTLLEKGPRGAAKKFGEEAVELVIAAVGESDEALRAEAADVLYHLLVLLKSRDVTLAEVLGELERRTMRSGHEEKASRVS